MLISPEQVAMMRRQAAVEGSTHQLALGDIRARVANPDVEAAYGGNATYRVGYKAVEAAFLSVLAEDPAEKRRYADIAYEAMMSWRGGSATLGRSMETRCMALTYAWGYRAFTDEQRTAMRRRLEGNARHLAGLQHGNLGRDRSSNFVGVIRGAELLARLALETDMQDQRVRFLIEELRRHIAHFSDLGTTQEGLGYAEYPGGFLFPAALAARERGDSTLYDQARRHAFWKLAMYTRTFSDLDVNRNVMWGVDHGSSHTEGWSTLQVPLVPSEKLPYYVYWLDRHLGIEALDQSRRFEADRHGTVWVMLYYPTDVEPRDPTGVFPPAIADNRGYVFFRNRWKDADDVLVSICAQTHLAERGWNQPEQLAINLMGFATRFIGGPEKGRGPEQYSSLLIDGQYTYRGATERMGELVAFEPTDSGGYAIVRGGQMYEAMGVQDVTRHMLVRFLPDGRAIVATLDRVRSDQERTITWQARIGKAIGRNEYVTAAALRESGRPGFLLRGQGDSYVKGWAPHPADASVSVGDDEQARLPAALRETIRVSPGPLQISTRGQSAEILVVMLIGRGDVPRATVRGDGLTSELVVEGMTIRVDAQSGRIVCR